jgi:spore coat polysaccharide biosynthesis protein SpsF
MKIGAIIQARTSSKRLPRKVLKELPYNSGITVLGNVIKRLEISKRLDEIIVATTNDPNDDDIIDITRKHNVKCFRGSKQNVLERFYLAAKQNGLDIIVRITGDCPCIDPGIVDSLIDNYMKTNSDYVSNVINRTFPHGLDAEVFSFSSLEEAYRCATTVFEREHVTPYIYQSNPNSFKITPVKAPKHLHGPEIRITLDTEEDYALLCTIYDYLDTTDFSFTAKDIVILFQEKPWLKIINQKVVQKKAFHDLKEELEETVKILDLQELYRAKEYLEGQLRAKMLFNR